MDKIQMELFEQLTGLHEIPAVLIISGQIAKRIAEIQLQI